jgi:hypothetical protein
LIFFYLIISDKNVHNFYVKITNEVNLGQKMKNANVATKFYSIHDSVIVVSICMEGAFRSFENERYNDFLQQTLIITQ